MQAATKVDRSLTLSNGSNKQVPKSRRRWFQYSLRDLLLLTVLCAIGMASLSTRIQRARRQHDAVVQTEASGGFVIYDYQEGLPGPLSPRPEPPGPPWIRKLLGDDFFTDVVVATVFGRGSIGEDLEGISDLRKAEQLVLVGIPMTEAVARRLANLGHLRTLIIVDEQFTDSHLRRLERLDQLEELDLTVTQVTESGRQHLQRVLPELRITQEREKGDRHQIQDK